MNKIIRWHAPFAAPRSTLPVIIKGNMAPVSLTPSMVATANNEAPSVATKVEIIAITAKQIHKTTLQ